MDKMNAEVFKGIKVAEFSWVVVGPSTSRYLAEHGATVVRIRVPQTAGHHQRKQPVCR